eukprot:2518315-Prymnesium_polylepis.1
MPNWARLGVGPDATTGPGPSVSHYPSRARRIVYFVADSEKVSRERRPLNTRLQNAGYRGTSHSPHRRPRLAPAPAHSPGVRFSARRELLDFYAAPCAQQNMGPGPGTGGPWGVC